jgi:DNA replication protein DnaC
MLTIPTLEQLRAMKLNGMAKGFEEQLASTDYDSMSFEERVGLMTDRERTERENRSLALRLRHAKLKQGAAFEDIEYRNQRGLDKSLVKSLASCRWIKDRLNVLMTGPTGVGKSFIAEALGHKACLEGFKVRAYRATRLFEELAVSRGDGRYARLMDQLAKIHLIIIDDWGLSKLGESEQKDFLELLEDRHNRHSTIVASQMPHEHWHELMTNPTLADAILDRLIHNSYKINLKGESMRKRKSKLTGPPETAKTQNQ